MALGSISLVLVAACSAPSATTSGGAATPPTPSAGSSSPDSSSATAAALHVVGLGDSYMSAQNSKGQSFMDLYAAQLEAKLGRSVDVTSLTADNATTASVRENLTTDTKYRDKVANADVIVISVGGNDSDPFGVYPRGTCAPGGTPAACLKAYAPTFAGNYDAILTAVSTLRAGKPTTIRVTSLDNPFVGWSQAPTPTFGKDFYAQVAAAETDTVCALATKHGAKCVDYLHIFSGKDGLADTSKYLDPDHNHPGELGLKVIADQLVRSGTPELS
jgi:lysophospholipase L1-like esterase